VASEPAVWRSGQTLAGLELGACSGPIVADCVSKLGGQCQRARLPLMGWCSNKIGQLARDWLACCPPRAGEIKLFALFSSIFLPSCARPSVCLSVCLAMSAPPMDPAWFWGRVSPFLLEFSRPTGGQKAYHVPGGPAAQRL